MLRLVAAAIIWYLLADQGYGWLGFMLTVALVVWVVVSKIRHYNRTHFVPFGAGILW